MQCNRAHLSIRASTLSAFLRRILWRVYPQGPATLSICRSGDLSRLTARNVLVVSYNMYPAFTPAYSYYQQADSRCLGETPWRISRLSIVPTFSGTDEPRISYSRCTVFKCNHRRPEMPCVLWDRSSYPWACLM